MNHKKIASSLLVAMTVVLMSPRAMSVTYSSADRARCFVDNPESKTVTFIFDNALWKVSSVSSVNVSGSFNQWKVKDEFKMTYDSDQKVWTLTLDYPTVKIPGNSGQLEYKFVTNGSGWQSGSGRSFIPEGYVFMTSDKNNIVVFDDDDFDTIKANSKLAGTTKSLSDFDLSTREDEEAVSNFRQVPSTSGLYRCYHPFKWSRSEYDTEPVRINLVKSLSEQAGIKGDICLSGDETGSLTSYTVGGVKYKEEIPEYYQDMIDKERVLYVGTCNGSTPSYNTVYYSPTSTKFGQWVKEVVDFINSDKTEAPYTIHCRLGTDRTGVFCAVLAALCGAPWSDIAADYQLTNRMCIREFRDYHLLQHSLQVLLGVDDINKVNDLPDALADYFTTNGILDQADIDNLKAKIGKSDGSSSVSVSDDIDETAEAEYYNLQGVRVLCPGAGVYICRRGTSVTKVLIK